MFWEDSKILVVLLHVRGVSFLPWPVWGFVEDLGRFIDRLYILGVRFFCSCFVVLTISSLYSFIPLTLSLSQILSLLTLFVSSYNTLLLLREMLKNHTP